MKKFALLPITAVLLAGQLTAQGYVQPMTALQSGEIGNLDKVTKVNIIYDFSNFGVGAYRDEKDFVEKKYKEYEAKEKGRGEQFKQSWEKDKVTIYPETFETVFNKYAPGDIKMTGKNNGTDAEYTLTVKTTFLEPGMNIGIAKKPAYVDMECTFTDKAGTELARYFVKNSVGSQAMGFDFDVAARVKESYGKGAKMLIGAIEKDRKKAAKKKK